MIRKEVMTMKKFLPVCLAAILLLGCQSKSASSSSVHYSADIGGMDNSAVTADEAVDHSNTGNNSALTTEDSEKKIVYTGNLSIETTDYNASMAQIQSDVKNGIITIESASEYVDSSNLRSNDLIIRVSSETYETYMDSASSLGSIRSRSSTRDDITKQYNDKSITIAALEKEQSRLQTMMDQAVTVDDMIAIESRLSEVETQLNQYKSDLANLDTDIAMSTVYLTLNEVLEYSGSSAVRKESTFLDRLTNTFADSWTFFVNLLEKLLFFVIYMIPIAIVVLVICFIYRQYRRKHPRKPKSEKNEGSIKPRE
ncbi:MAG: DUF4349 domain-containing protein [Erysipelotrichia bacterium]|nr:DUF4349 domain-containing protein [Erysipelotrichia bacterium]